MRKVLVGAVWILAGCASAQGTSGALAARSPDASQGTGASVTNLAAAVAASDSASPTGPITPSDGETPPASSTWIGASAESDVLLAGTDETIVGVWVDAPRAKTSVRPRVDLALVVDTSGSMAGEKITNARAAARTLVESLADGDIVSIDTFSDEAHVLVAPTTVNAMTRERVLGAIAELRVAGSTNMFDGLTLAESQTARAPSTHAVRRVVVISDGIANVGPSSPESLGMIAERGAQSNTQVTALGVGIDYDERTLNALAVRSSGRLYHLTEPSEMTSIVRREAELLGSTVASDAFVEVIPAPGVQLAVVDGVRTEWGTHGALRIPLGVLFAGQHREALVRARFQNSGSWGASAKPLASVRLHFHDPNEGDLERVQEVVARVQLTTDAAAVALHANARTQSIVAIQDAAKLEMKAAQSVNQGQFGDADTALAGAEAKLKEGASRAHDERTRQRLDAAAANVASARVTTHAAAAAPAPVQMESAKKLNSAGMSDMGY